MGNIGTAELIIGLVIVVLLFGAKRLPEAARGIGQSLRIFKSEMKGPAADDAAQLVALEGAQPDAPVSRQV